MTCRFGVFLWRLLCVVVVCIGAVRGARPLCGFVHGVPSGCWCQADAGAAVVCLASADGEPFELNHRSPWLRSENSVICSVPRDGGAYMRFGITGALGCGELLGFCRPGDEPAQQCCEIEGCAACDRRPDRCSACDGGQQLDGGRCVGAPLASTTVPTTTIASPAASGSTTTSDSAPTPSGSASTGNVATITASPPSGGSTATGDAATAPAVESGGVDLVAIFMVLVGVALLLIAVLAFFYVKRRREEEEDSLSDNTVYGAFDGDYGGAEVESMHQYGRIELPNSEYDVVASRNSQKYDMVSPGALSEYEAVSAKLKTGDSSSGSAKLA